MLNHNNKHSIHIAFLGPKGSYSHIAAKKYSNIHHINCNNIIEHSCKRFSDIIKMVENGNVEYGILPIENSTSGSIGEVQNLMKYTNVSLIEEIILPIKYYILTNNAHITFNKIKKIYSHPQLFLQCNNLANNFPRCNVIHCASTSAAMQIVAKLNIPTIAALGSKFGGILYGLKTLKINLGNNKENTTRFIIIGHKTNVIKKIYNV